VAYHRAPISMNLTDLEGHFNCLNSKFSNSHRPTVYKLQYVYPRIGKRTWLVIATVISKLKDV